MHFPRLSQPEQILIPQLAAGWAVDNADAIWTAGRWQTSTPETEQNLHLEQILMSSAAFFVSALIQGSVLLSSPSDFSSAATSLPSRTNLSVRCALDE